MALAGRPERESPALTGAEETSCYDGWIKVRLGHGDAGSVLVPDQIVIRHTGWRFYQPSFFSPNVLGFNIEPDLHEARFSVDVGSPRGAQPTRLIVTFRSDGMVRCYDDGSHVYRCWIEGPRSIQRFASGQCVPTDEGAFDLRLFHHTTPENYPKIKSSGELWSSPWNLAGVRKLENVYYGYLTSLDRVTNAADLARIAMASAGKLCFQTTSSRPTEEVVELTVYRDDTTGRTASLPLDLPWELISPPHLVLHQPPFDQAYYEVVAPEIFRIGMQQGCRLRIDGRRLFASNDERKQFEYIVLGNASTVEGLIAPYDEEGTAMVMHLQRFEDGQSLFDFWLANQNSDQMDGREFEAVRVERRIEK